MTLGDVRIACIVGLCLACGRKTNGIESNASASAVHSSSTRASEERAPSLLRPTRLMKLPISAYSTSLALDDDAVYLLTSNAAYRLVAEKPAQGIELELGIGAVLTRTNFSTS